jgi:hypothetical protein
MIVVPAASQQEVHVLRSGVGSGFVGCAVLGDVYLSASNPGGAILESPLVVATIPQNQQVSKVDETLLATGFSPWYHEQHEQMLQLDCAQWKHMPACREDSVRGRGGAASMQQNSASCCSVTKQWFCFIIARLGIMARG